MENTYTPENKTYGNKIFIGILEGEEFFITPVKWDCGWYWGGVYLEGLRATTEEKQREYARDCEMSDYFDVENIPSQFLNEEAFKEDQEENWEERADIQERQDRNGEEVLLTYGTHTHADSVLLNDCKGDYITALEHFDSLVFTQTEFNELIKLLRKFYELKEGNSRTDKDYLGKMENAEETLKDFEKFTEKFDKLPKEEFWTELN